MCLYMGMHGLVYVIYLQALNTERLDARASQQQGAHTTQMWVSKLQSLIKGTRAPRRRKRLIPRLGQGKHKISLEDLVVSEVKKCS